MEGDQPVPGDYDADGRTELAVRRLPRNGVELNTEWLLYNLSSKSSQRYVLGFPGDVPLAPPRALRPR